jgi:serine phosphatase RsbU (regulator of sigma subunit)
MGKKKSKAPGGRPAPRSARPAQAPKGKRKPSSRLKAAPPPKKGKAKKGRRGAKEDSGRMSGSGSSDKGVRAKSGGDAAFLRPEGMKLSVKFVLIISSLIAVVMLISSLAIYFIAVGKLSSEIEDSGAAMVNSVESIAKAYFEDRKILYARYEKDLVGADVAPDPPDPNKKEDDTDDWGNDPKPADPGDEARRNERIADYKNLKKLMTDRYNDYLEALISMGLKSKKGGGRKVLNAFIDCADPSYNLNPRSTTAISQRQGSQNYTFQGKSTGIAFQKCRIRSGEGRRSREALLFKKTINVRGSDKGTAYLALSAEIISDAKGSLLLNILIFTLFAVAAGVGVSFILAAQISQPVQHLLEDMSRVSKGDFNHVTKAHSKDEIGVLARTFNAMTQSLKVAKDAEVQNQARQHDMKIATEIQAGLLPSKIPQIPGFELAAFYQPSKEVGGDYYDFMQIDQEHLVMVVADVSGKGIPGSMVMTMARSLIRMEGSRNLSAADTLKKVNKVIARDIRRGMFVTAIYIILNVKTRKMQVASAGHNPMILYRAKSKSYDLVNPNGIALGFDKGPIFDRTIKEEEIQLEKGDRAVIYTDGIPESMNVKNEEFGDDEFYDLVSKSSTLNSNQFINVVVATVRKHQGKAEQHDDITIATLQVT